jgi:hypothetical protein
MPKVTVEMLRDLEERASALLGDRYAGMVAERSNGLDHPGTPPKNPHRLVGNLRRLAASRETMERGTGAIDIGAAARRLWDESEKLVAAAMPA